MSKRTKVETASTGESLAAGFLEKSGYQIIGRNYHSAHGEIDIIAMEDTELVFVEVKTRTGIAFQIAENSVTTKKQQKLTFTAMNFISENPEFSKNCCRFDVISVLYRPIDDTFSVRHLKNAFIPILLDNDY